MKALFFFKVKCSQLLAKLLLFFSLFQLFILQIFLLMSFREVGELGGVEGQETAVGCFVCKERKMFHYNHAFPLTQM